LERFKKEGKGKNVRERWPEPCRRPMEHSFSQKERALVQRAVITFI